MNRYARARRYDCTHVGCTNEALRLALAGTCAHAAHNCCGQHSMWYEATGALAYTPDEEIARGVEEFKRTWPDKWEAWLRWCQSEETRGEPEMQ